MPAITTDPYANKQVNIDKRKRSIINSYSSLWQKLIADWAKPDQEDLVWLLYSANYLFRTAGVRWALDPVTLRHRIPIAPAVDVSGLAALDLIVLTHRHADHLDLTLLEEMRNFPACIIVPEFLLDSISSLNLNPEKLIISSHLKTMRFGGLTLTPFNGSHWESDASQPDMPRGVPSMGYLAEFNRKRWLIPGDIRAYDASRLPEFGPVDGLLMHLWLGRGCALQAEFALLDPFCRFCLDLAPDRIVISHLEEFGRKADDYWDDQHVEIIKSHFNKVFSNKINISTAHTGDNILL